MTGFQWQAEEPLVLSHFKEKELTPFPSLDWTNHSVAVCANTCPATASADLVQAFSDGFGAVII